MTATTPTALPVAVYIHGGGFEFGANTQITSKAAGIAVSGRVVGVSINYRLAALDLWEGIDRP